MIKLIVSDFDGTLLPYGEKRVSESVISKIKSYLDNGISFAVASGRTYTELKALLNDVSDKIYFIADDGALIIKNDKILSGKPFTSDAIKCFFNNESFRDAVLYSLDKAYLINSSKITTLGKTPRNIKRAFEVTEDIYKISANMNDMSLINNENFRIHYANEKFAEFVSPYSNKGIALSLLQLHLSITKFETLAIGDADNDIPMMLQSNLTVSIGNKSKKLLENSKHNVLDIYSAFETTDFYLKSNENNTKQHKFL